MIQESFKDISRICFSPAVYYHFKPSLYMCTIHNVWLITKSGLWFLMIFLILGFFYKSSFASKFYWKKRSSHQGKKEVSCIVSKPLVSCLWGCGESVNPPKIKHPGGSGGLCPLDQRGDPGLLPIFQDLLLLSNHTSVKYLIFISILKLFEWLVNTPFYQRDIFTSYNLPPPRSIINSVPYFSPWYTIAVLREPWRCYWWTKLRKTRQA